MAASSTASSRWIFSSCSGLLFALWIIFFALEMGVFTFHEASLVIAGLGMGWPGAGGMGVGATPPR